MVTGANSGIGLATTTRLAADGHHVVMACRKPDKAERAADEVRRLAPAGIEHGGGVPEKAPCYFTRAKHSKGRDPTSVSG